MKDTEYEGCEEQGPIIRKDVPDMVRSGLNRKLLRKESVAQMMRSHCAEAASPRSKEVFCC